MPKSRSALSFATRAIGSTQAMLKHAEPDTNIAMIRGISQQDPPCCENPLPPEAVRDLFLRGRAIFVALPRTSQRCSRQPIFPSSYFLATTHLVSNEKRSCTACRSPTSILCKYRSVVLMFVCPRIRDR